MKRNNVSCYPDSRSRNRAFSSLVCLKFQAKHFAWNETQLNLSAYQNKEGKKKEKNVLKQLLLI